MSAKPRETANVGAGLWKATGMWAWVLFRISGLVLVFYLCAHIVIISTGQFGTMADAQLPHEDLRESCAGPSGPALVWPCSITRSTACASCSWTSASASSGTRSVFWVAMAVVVICFAFFAWVAFIYSLTGTGGDLVMKAETVSTHTGRDVVVVVPAHHRRAADRLTMAVHLIFTHILNIGELNYDNDRRAAGHGGLHRRRHHPALRPASTTR